MWDAEDVISVDSNHLVDQPSSSSFKEVKLEPDNWHFDEPESSPCKSETQYHAIKPYSEQVSDVSERQWYNENILKRESDDLGSGSTVKLERDETVDETTITETENVIEDSKPFIEQLIHVEKFWKTEDVTLIENCITSCVKRELKNDTVSEDSVGKTNGSDCHNCDNRATIVSTLDNRIDEKNKCQIYDDDKSELEHMDDKGVKEENDVCTVPECTTSSIDSPKFHIDSVRPELKTHIFDYATLHKSNLDPHIDDVHPKLKSHKCHMCEYKARTKSNLKIHIDGVHFKLRSRKCHLCEFTTSQSSNLKLHIDSVHLKLKTHECHLCEYTTALKGNLRVHIDSVHMNLKNHKCQLCEYTTTQNSKLQLHIDSVHLKLKNYKCHLCQFTTVHKYAVKVHIDSVHLKLKNEKCHLCDYATPRKNKLKLHIDSVHLNLKNHKCELCDYTTTRKCTLQDHIKAIHLKLKNHKCQLCDFATTTSTILKRHAHSVHQIVTTK